MTTFFTDSAVSGGFFIPVAVHASHLAPALIVNYPGYGGTIEGYNNKYVTLANHMAECSLGAVIRMPNTLHEGRDYSKSVIEDLRAVIKFAIDRAGMLCNCEKPDIYLMGSSAGGGAIAAVAGEYPAVTKILLLEPAGNAGGEIMQQGLARYRGDLFIVVGSGKDAIGTKYGSKLVEWATQARRKELVVLKGCDHNFSGKRNGQIMAKAPFWAFGGDTTFPSPDGGLVLYE